MSYMQFKCDAEGIRYTYITHPTIPDHPPIEFDTSLYKLVAKQDISTQAIFIPINLFIQKALPLEKQLQLFAYYEAIHEALDRSNDITIAMDTVQSLLAEVLNNIITYEILDTWRRTDSNIPTPADLVQTFYSEVANPRTYNVENYHGLIVISLVSRFMVPIWGHFNSRNKYELPEDMVEFYAYKLLAKTWLWNHDTTVLLEDYLTNNMIVENILKSNGANSAITAGVATYDLPKYLLAHSLVRRSPIPDMYSTEKSSNLIAIFYKYAIDNIGKQLNKKFAGRIEEKQKPKGRTEGGDNITMADNCKIKQLVPDGDFVIHNSYIRNKWPDMVTKLCQTYPEIIKPSDFDLYGSFYKSVSLTTQELLKLEQDDEYGDITNIFKFRTVMVAWAFGAVESPYPIINAGVEETTIMLALASCYLVATKHHHIATWLNSVPILSESSRMVDESSIPGNRCMEVSQLYPHFHQTQKVDKRSFEQQRKRVNPAVTGSQEAVKLIPFLEWRVMMPPELTAHLTLLPPGAIQSNGTYYAPSSRLNVILNYAAHIGQNNQ